MANHWILAVWAASASLKSIDLPYSQMLRICPFSQVLRIAASPAGKGAASLAQALDEPLVDRVWRRGRSLLLHGRPAAACDLPQLHALLL